MSKLRRREFLMAGVAAAAIAGLPKMARAKATRSLRIGMSATNVNSLDPRRSVQNADNFVQRQIYDSLLDPPYGTFDLDYADVVTELAESWQVSPDSKTWTVKLKQGVQFQKDAGELTSEDVKFTYDTIMDKTTGSTQRVYITDLESVEAVDKYQVKFHLNKPNPNFHASGLISIIGSIVPKSVAGTMTMEQYARQPVGTGPYEVAGTVSGGGVTLKAFEKYHGKKPEIDTVEFRYMADPTARTLALLKGDLDIIEGARLPGWVGQLKQQMPNVVIDQTRPGSINTLYFNMSMKPFDDIRVRKALRYGIDRNTIITAFGGIAGPAWGINPPEFPGGFKETELPEELRYNYDPEKAKALLAEAGHGDGLKFEIIMTQREDYASIMLMVQDMWREIGVDMTIRTIDHTTYHAEKDKNVNAIVLQSSTFAPVSTQIPVTYYRSGAEVKSDGSGDQNYSHYGAIGGPGVDDLLDQALAEGDLAKRQEIVRQAELKILADMPAFTICTLSFVYARNPRLDLGFDVKAGYARYRLGGAKFTS
jgi:peptide/nickel transport system substrate-binding protein